MSHSIARLAVWMAGDRPSGPDDAARERQVGYYLVGKGMPELAVALMNWLCLFLTHPRRLPWLDFSAGIPDGCRWSG